MTSLYWLYFIKEKKKNCFVLAKPLKGVFANLIVYPSDPLPVAMVIDF